MNYRQLLFVVIALFCVKFSFSQTVNADYLNPANNNGNPTYGYIRFGTADDYYGGFMWNKSLHSGYGNGDDFSIFTYYDYDMTFRTGTGNVIFFPSAGGNIGVGTTNPKHLLHLYKYQSNNTIALQGSAAYWTITNQYSQGGDLEFAENGATKLLIKKGGAIGIGTSNTGVDGNLQIGHSTGYGMIHLGGGRSYAGIGSTRSDGGLILGKNIYARYNDYNDDGKAWVGGSGNKGFAGMKFSPYGRIDFFSKNGSVTADDHANATENIRMTLTSAGKLLVFNAIEATELKVTQQPGADFVFSPDYQLRPLFQLETFIQENKHLPEIAPAKDMEKNGVLQTEMNQKLLQKIEELTLYTIQQQKEIERLKKIEAELAEIKKLLKK